MAAKIARGIVQERAWRGPITGTRQLARIVARAKGTRERIDPATRVFQALRIEVNQELVALSSFLAAAVARLNARRPARRHLVSLARGPDRQGRRSGASPASASARRGCPPASAARGGVLKILTRRPIVPSPAEVSGNPRSRSARLRVAEKLDGETRESPSAWRRQHPHRSPPARRAEGRDRARRERRRLRPVQARREPAPDARAGPPPRARARHVPARRTADRLRAARLRGAPRRDRARRIRARGAPEAVLPSSTRRTAACAPSSPAPPRPTRVVAVAAAQGPAPAAAGTDPVRREPAGRRRAR